MTSRPAERRMSFSLGSYDTGTRPDFVTKYEGPQKDLLSKLWADILDTSPMPVKISEIKYEKSEKESEKLEKKEKEYTGNWMKNASAEEGDSDGK